MMTPQILTRPLPGTVFDALYPDSDGKPMGETDFHISAIILLREGLKDFFAADGRNDVYVASNMFFYYEQGNPSGHRDPDVLVAKGVGNHFRRSFRVWEEGVTPQALFEISSPSTWREDLVEKRALYAQLGVAEYFLFDPEGDCLDPRLQGFRLEEGEFVPLIHDADGGLTSAVLGLRLTPEDYMLRLSDLHTGAIVQTRSERANDERDRAEQERRRAEEEHFRAELERRRAEEERRRAEQEHLQVEQERRRAEELTAEVARLKALLEEYKGKE
jgi:Uma2 family endonuclease